MTNFNNSDPLLLETRHFFQFPTSSWVVKKDIFHYLIILLSIAPKDSFIVLTEALSVLSKPQELVYGFILLTTGSHSVVNHVFGKRWWDNLPDGWTIHPRVSCPGGHSTRRDILSSDTGTKVGVAMKIQN